MSRMHKICSASLKYYCLLTFLQTPMEFVLHQLLLVKTELVNYCLFILRPELIPCAGFCKFSLHSSESQQHRQ